MIGRPTGFTGLLDVSLLLVDPAWGGERSDSHTGSDGPWFTGTLLSSRGATVEQGHAVIEPYLYYTRYGGLYNDNWRLQSAALSETVIQQTYVIYGLTNE